MIVQAAALPHSTSMTQQRTGFAGFRHCHRLKSPLSSSDIKVDGLSVLFTQGCIFAGYLKLTRLPNQHDRFKLHWQASTT